MRGWVDGEAWFRAGCRTVGKSATAPFEGDAGTAPERMACPRPAGVGGRGEDTREEEVCSASEFSGAADRCSGLAESFAVAAASVLLVISTAPDSVVWKSGGTAPLFRAGRDTPLCTASATSAVIGWVDAGLDAASKLDQEGVPRGR